MEEVISKLKSLFKTKEEISMAFLFGSAAADKMIPESDVDVAVWFGGEFQIKEVDKLQGEIESILDRNVDLIVLNSARPAVAWRAMRGKQLLIRDYKLFLLKMLDISREAEEMQDFIMDLWSLRRKYRGGF